LVGVAGCFGQAELLVVMNDNRRPVLGPPVVALAHSLRRVMVLPEDLQQLVVARLGRVEYDADGLGVTGPAGTRLLVSRVGRVAALVANGGGPNAGQLPERLLFAPEAT